MLSRTNSFSNSDLVAKILELGDLEEIDLVRLMILIRVFKGRKTKNEAVNGLTKLAKLDFFLRYPKLLQKALEIKGQDPHLVELKPFEKNSIESKMVRYKYGPWDFDFKKWLLILEALEFITIEKIKRTIYIDTTEKGKEFGDFLKAQENFQKYKERAKLLKRHFDRSGTYLKEFIYEHFPSILSLNYGDEIEYEELQA